MAGERGAGEQFHAIQAPTASSLRADFNNDGAEDLAVGTRFEGVGAIVAAGAVTVLYGSAGGVTGAGSQQFTQDTAGVAGSAELNDLFGFALAASGGQEPTGSPASPPGSATAAARARD